MANKITVTWDKRIGKAGIKTPGQKDKIYFQLVDVFDRDFLAELKDLGADLKSLKITFKKVNQDNEPKQVQGQFEGF